MGNTKYVEKYAELPTKHEPKLKSSSEEWPKTSLAPISLIEKLEQSLYGLRKPVTPQRKGNMWDVVSISFVVYESLDGLRKHVTPRRKSNIWDVMLMSISFAVYVYILQKIVCAYCMWWSMLKH